MRPIPNMRVEQFRFSQAPFVSSIADGNNGVFEIPSPLGITLTVFVSDGLGWEHVSVSTQKRTPRWEEMDYIKRLFWDDEEMVMQLHPPRSLWVNNHPYCLHLWKPMGIDIPSPSQILVGIPGFEGRVEA